VATGQPAVRVQRAPARAPAPAPAFTTSLSYLAFAFDPRAGYALVGVHAPDGEPPRLRAYDVVGGRVAWDAFTGDEALDGLDYESIAVRAGHVYVGVGRSFRVLDLFTGQQKWGAELPDDLAYDSGHFTERGARVVDPAQPGGGGPVWAIAVDDTIAAFDRATGQPLWREVREEMPRRIRTLEPSLLLLERGGVVEVVDPATRKVLESVGPRVERLDLEGRYGLMQVHRFGWRERDGILVHDFAAHQEALFDAVERIEDDVPCVAAQNRVFCALESGAKLYAAPGGKPIELMAGMHVRALAACGPTVMVLLSKHHGTSYRRLLGVDAQTMAVRFDLGEWTTEPNDDWSRQLCSNGHVTVAVTSPTDDGDDCELVAVDPAGRIAWRLAVGEWKAHAFVGGHVVVLSSRGWQVVRPDNGQVIASYANRQDD
jgi:outer membrane protein assembly factor BamB